jgi:hypothetical protein
MLKFQARKGLKTDCEIGCQKDELKYCVNSKTNITVESMEAIKKMKTGVSDEDTREITPCCISASLLHQKKE